MKKNLLTLCCVMFATYFTSFSQTSTVLPSPARNCGTMEHLENSHLINPSIKLRMQEIERFTNRVIQSTPNRLTETVNGIIRIPVVVHVLYNDSTQNISESQIQSQIEVLNEDFRKLNSDVENVPAEFAGLAADIGIEFYLSTVDPEGNSTSGITRTFTTQNKFGTNDNVKRSSKGGKDPWPTDKYLNIWTCNLSFFLGELLGYAQFPGGDPQTDGVVINYKYFGRGGNTIAPFNGGRTATHEVGHWLNLRHIWGDGGCGATDFVDDTPDAQQEYYGCPAYPSVSCGTSDMFMNYMDYVNDNCMSMFSNGQKDRMLALFAPGGARESFVNNEEPLDYCASTAQENLSWIDGVKINNTTNVSGDDNGYGDYTANAIALEKGANYLFAAQVKYQSKKAPLNFRFWIDYNQDSDFDDVGELVFEGRSANIAKSTISIPSEVLSGATRVRISAKYGAYPTSCETFQYGEVEDYTIEIKEEAITRGATLTATKSGTSAMELYPNPSEGESEAIIDLGKENTTVAIVLTDSRGKTIASKVLNNVNGIVSHSFSTMGLRKGIYFVKVRSAAINEVQKLIVE